MATDSNITHSVANPRNDLTFEYVSTRYSYDPETGIILNRWGRRVGFNHSTGYRHIEIAGIQRKEHRIAWLLHYREWPEGQIDHINRNKSDNKIKNLRDASGTKNQFNIEWNKNNTTGFRGVKAGYGGKFTAKIGINGKHNHLGTFLTAHDAHAAYVSAKAELDK